MESVLESRVYALFTDALQSAKWVDAAEILGTVRAPDRADFFLSLSIEEQIQIFPFLPSDLAARTFTRIEPAAIAILFEQLGDDIVVPVLDAMAGDDQADFIEALSPVKQAQLLPHLRQKDSVEKLLAYPVDSAGALMNPEVLVVSQRLTAHQTLERVKQFESPGEQLHNVFIIDHLHRLRGIVSLFDLVKAASSQPIFEIMDADVVSVDADTDQEECALLFNRYDQMTLPVVDDNRRIIGGISFDDLVGVLVKEADEDLARMGAASPINASYLKVNVLTMVRNRASWLILLFVAATMTTTIIAAFESELESVAVLAVFIPLLIGTGGNAGAQTTTTIIRAMAMHQISLRDSRRVWLKEMCVGGLLGVVMAVMTSVLALVMFSNSELALTVGITVFCIVLSANFVGSLLPMIAHRMGLDPTLVSGPAITTIVDSVGLIIYFSIAQIIFGI
ncbi:Magnesium transporter MgtE [BD1-7 clade bacterium]|uniref:Magnesium transporter MgtE n=1 Tax=BD1-7 clade bacterium TaxID=2029982 RepID=A0A5S9QT75_9GAMM|nr:Magnesium transporter MgtE [BD1-7 clade bacterium]CAA0122707.1 Magnesium transporter MgtE [BD1-7 clade bacterium]